MSSSSGMQIDDILAIISSKIKKESQKEFRQEIIKERNKNIQTLTDTYDKNHLNDDGGVPTIRGISGVVARSLVKKNDVSAIIKKYYDRGFYEKSSIDLSSLNSGLGKKETKRKKGFDKNIIKYSVYLWSAIGAILLGSLSAVLFFTIIGGSVTNLLVTIGVSTAAGLTVGAISGVVDGVLTDRKIDLVKEIAASKGRHHARELISTEMDKKHSEEIGKLRHKINDLDSDLMSLRKEVEKNDDTHSKGQDSVRDGLLEKTKELKELREKLGKAEEGLLVNMQATSDLQGGESVENSKKEIANITKQLAKLEEALLTNMSATHDLQKGEKSVSKEGEKEIEFHKKLDFLERELSDDKDKSFSEKEVEKSKQAKLESEISSPSK